MSQRALQLGFTAALAAALWVIPSVGTRGQGTLGDRFVHTDETLVPPTAEGRDLLDTADTIVAAAVAGL